jgi:hypothetical protein
VVEALEGERERERERERASEEGASTATDEESKEKKHGRSYLRVKVHWRALQPDPFGLNLVGAQRQVP